MAESWDEHAEGWDESEDVRHYGEQAFALLTAYVDVRDDSWRQRRVLDFGCGTGLLTEKLSPFVGEVVAIDTSPKMIEVLRTKDLANVTALVANMSEPATRALPQFEERFDLIVASSVLAFVPDYVAMVETLTGLLESGGFLVQWDWLADDDSEFGLTREQISAAFDAAGLASVHIGEVFSIEGHGKAMPVLMGVARAG